MGSRGGKRRRVPISAPLFAWSGFYGGRGLLSVNKRGPSLVCIRPPLFCVLFCASPGSRWECQVGCVVLWGGRAPGPAVGLRGLLQWGGAVSCPPARAQGGGGASGHFASSGLLLCDNAERRCANGLAAGSARGGGGGGGETALGFGFPQARLCFPPPPPHLRLPAAQIDQPAAQNLGRPSGPLPVVCTVRRMRPGAGRGGGECVCVCVRAARNANGQQQQ